MVVGPWDEFGNCVLPTNEGSIGGCCINPLAQRGMHMIDLTWYMMSLSLRICVMVYWVHDVNGAKRADTSSQYECNKTDSVE